jgi:PleD family two-component response regulator
LRLPASQATDRSLGCTFVSSLPTAIERRLPGGARRLRVLLIDDHPAIRAGLAVVLDVDPGITAVAAAASARDGLLQAGSLELDVVVVDGYLPGEDGLWLVPRNNGVNA